MKRLLFALLLLLIIGGSFLAGSRYSQREGAKLNPLGVKSPAVNYDKTPGTDTDTDTSSPPPGSVKISSEKQQLIGIRLGQVEKTSGTHSLRTLGRVVIDENRIYRLITPVEGWVKEIHSGTTGSIVQKDQLLAHFYSRDILNPQQAYFYALNALDRFKKEGMDTPAQVSSTNLQIRSAEESLLALGMGETQIKEIAKTRQATRDIEIRAPVTGLVLQRNIYPKQRFERGTEWYRIADISRVWIQADIFENEAHYLGPGVHAKVTLPYQKKMFHAMVSDTPPQFDPNTRTLKVRLEADNPGGVLRPDMFVDVELPVKLPSAITVPADAILDSGLKKTVFVDRGNGIFEPREVETGWRLGDRVQILKGLEAGERIVISGNFLIDSESKLEMAAAGMQEPLSKDPVSGLEVSPKKAEKAGRKISYHGQTYYFDSNESKQQFEKNPERYALKPAAGDSPAEPTPSSKPSKKQEPRA